MQDLKIDPEFRDKIPPIPKEDFDGLRSDILRDGYVRDPLVVWDEENTLLDGHHRWRVIQEHPELPYTTDRKSFPDRWAAIAWICANQLHKHNLNDIQKAKLMQEEYEARQRSSGFQVGHPQYRPYGDEIHHHTEKSHKDGSKTAINNNKNKTRKLIAHEHGVSEHQVQLAVEMGRGLDKAAEVDPEFKREVLSGEVKAQKSDLAAIRKLDTPDEVQDAVNAIRSGGMKKSGNQSAQPPQDESDRTEYGRTRKLLSDIRKIGEKIAEEPSKKYTTDNLIDELCVMCDYFVDQLNQTLKQRKSVIGNGERVLELLESFEKKIVDVETRIAKEAKRK